MSLLNVFDIAGTALSAQSIRLNVTASNLANVNSVGGSPETTYMKSSCKPVLTP